MLARARSIAMAGLIMAACSGDDSGPDFVEGMDPGTDGTSDAGPVAADGDVPSNDDGDDADGNPADACRNGEEALVKGLTISEIAVYQTVKVPVAQNGEWLTSRNAPLVQGKKALVRVFVEPQAGFSSHPLTGVVTIDNGSGPKYVTDDFTPQGASSDDQPASTLNFQLDGADIGADTRFSVAVVEKGCPDEVGEASDARFPASGLQALGARHIGKLRVVVVPVEVNDNGLIPDTSAAQLEKMREAMLAYFPVPEVEISAREPISFKKKEIGSWGQGWAELLNEIGLQRQRDGVADDVYYYGVITPEVSLAQFCSGGGCVLGLAPQTVWVSPEQQVGMGVGYVHDETYTTMVHEVGHAHGRGHAPCGGANGVDEAFPNSSADTDVWGWDSREGSLIRPTAKDVMGYCKPVWISAYTYSALAERCLEVNTQFSFAEGSDINWVGLIGYGDRTARWSGHNTRRMPGGETELAIVKDAAGQIIDEVDVVRVTLSHLDDSFIYLPNPQPEWATIVLGDRELEVRDIKPAR